MKRKDVGIASTFAGTCSSRSFFPLNIDICSGVGTAPHGQIGQGFDQLDLWTTLACFILSSPLEKSPAESSFLLERLLKARGTWSHAVPARDHVEPCQGTCQGQGTAVSEMSQPFKLFNLPLAPTLISTHHVLLCFNMFSRCLQNCDLCRFLASVFSTGSSHGPGAANSIDSS